MSMTLQEIMPAVRQLPAVEKIELLHFLEQEAQAMPDITPFVAGRTYDFYTPYDCPGAAAILMQELMRAEAEEAENAK